VVLGGLFYFMLIRPQRTRAKRHEQMMKTLEVGDEVQTIGGIYGTIEYFDEEDNAVILQIEDGTRIRFSRRALSEKMTRGTE
jgi:preprotein translocase subunit YajC